MNSSIFSLNFGQTETNRKVVELVPASRKKSSEMRKSFGATRFVAKKFIERTIDGDFSLTKQKTEPMVDCSISSVNG